MASWLPLFQSPTFPANINVGHSWLDYMFKNFAKMAQSINTTAGDAYPAKMDNGRGYFTSKPTHETSWIMYVPPSYSAQKWKAKYTGVGCEFRIAGNLGGISIVAGSTISGDSNSFTMGGTNPSVEFTVAPGTESITLTLCTTGTFSTPYDNFVFCRTGGAYTTDEADIDSGNPLLMFNADYINEMIALNAASHRHLDWAWGLNTVQGSNYSKYRYFTPSDAFSFACVRWDHRAWAGDVTATVVSSVDVYACSAPSDITGTPTHGDMVQCRFVTPNTQATATLNVGTFGAYTIFNSGQPGAGVAIGANTLSTLVFDGNLNGWLLYNANGGTDGMWASIPIDVKAALSQLTRKPAYVCYPHLMGNSDVTTLTNALKAILPYGMLVQLSNEDWNPFYGHMHQGTYIGAALGFTQNPGMSWFAKRNAEVMPLIKTAWGATSAPLTRILAVQAYGNATYDTYYFRGGELGAYGFDTSPNMPVEQVEALSKAPYAWGANLVQFAELYTGDQTALFNAADDHASGNPTRIAAALAYVDNDLRQGTSGGVLGAGTLKYQHDTLAPFWKFYADKYGKKVHDYEGSWSAVGPMTADLPGFPGSGTTSLCAAIGRTDLGYGAAGYGGPSLVQNLLDAYKDSAAFQQLVVEQLRVWRDIGANAGAYPSILIMDAPLNGSPAKRNQWGWYKTDLYGAKFKSRDGFIQFNNSG